MLLETVIAFVVMLLVVAAMAIGVMLTGRRISGSCGGLSAMPGAESCGVCGRSLREDPQKDCDRQER